MFASAIGRLGMWRREVGGGPRECLVKGACHEMGGWPDELDPFVAVEHRSDAHEQEGGKQECH
jgi:hypothetical protein